MKQKFVKFTDTVEATCRSEDIVLLCVRKIFCSIFRFPEAGFREIKKNFVARESKSKKVKDFLKNYVQCQSSGFGRKFQQKS